jgi:acetyl-CoA carboxylase carboxyltransferase component
MHPDCCLALASARPALMGPEAAINAIHANRIATLGVDEARAFVEEKRREYKEDIDVFSVANAFSIEAVVPGDELRDELIRRFTAYSRKRAQGPARRNGVLPI